MNGIADFLNFTKDVGQNFYQNVLADPSTYSFQKNPDEFNLRDVTDIIFDPDDPIDKASLALLLFPLLLVRQELVKLLERVVN